MTIVFNTPQELLDAGTRPLGVSEWLLIDQARIQQFAGATGDHHWIYVDPVRAQDGPFGACVAHGYLLLSLVNAFLPQLMQVRGITMGVNVGCGEIRFPEPVRVGSRIRGRGELTEATAEKGGVQATVRVTVEIDGHPTPGCVVDTISRYFASNG
jgi:acyl dehydratase